jgi:hypothetical protein
MSSPGLEPRPRSASQAVSADSPPPHRLTPLVLAFEDGDRPRKLNSPSDPHFFSVTLTLLFIRRDLRVNKGVRRSHWSLDGHTRTQRILLSVFTRHVDSHACQGTRSQLQLKGPRRVRFLNTDRDERVVLVRPLASEPFDLHDRRLTPFDLHDRRLTRPPPVSKTEPFPPTHLPCLPAVSAFGSNFLSATTRTIKGWMLLSRTYPLKKPPSLKVFSFLSDLPFVN